MKVPIKLIFSHNNKSDIDLIIKFNGTQISADICWKKDKFGNMIAEFTAKFLNGKNEITLNVLGLDTSSDFIINDIIIDHIRFEVATFLCVKTNKDRSVNIELHHPIWQWWCELMNDFNYEKYPLGSIN